MSVTQRRTSAAELTPQTAQVGGRLMEFVDVGRGPALLLVHGTGGGWSFWRQNIAELSSSFRVIAPSLPGCGGSQRLPKAPVDLMPYADALTDLLDHLDVQSATVVGHSLGGLVALRFALWSPQRVARLVLVDSGGAPMGQVRLAAVTRSLLLMRFLCSQPEFVRFVITRPRIRGRMLGAALRAPGSMTTEMLTEGLQTFGVPGVVDAIRAGTREQGASPVEWLTVPTTVVWGALDNILPLGLGVNLADLVPGATLAVVEGAGHAPMIDRPQAFAVILRASGHTDEQAAQGDWHGRLDSDLVS